ncbi:hypothetical protein D3C81_1970490 [compost metagenome]
MRLRHKCNFLQLVGGSSQVTNTLHLQHIDGLKCTRDSTLPAAEVDIQRKKFAQFAVP